VGKRYLIDSNDIVDFLKKALPESGRKLLFSIDPLISIITFIEVFANSKASEEEVKQLQSFCDVATVYNVGFEIASVTIKLRKKYKIKLPDTLIAATASYNNLVLITRNVSDFEKIEGIEIINPHSI
jgi:predicted nucleic acid-binding protein